MRLVLFLITLIIFFVTKRYNKVDWFRNFYVDVLVQILHIITILFILYNLILYKYILISLFCIYILYKNVQSLIENFRDLYTEEDDNDKIEVDTVDEKER